MAPSRQTQFNPDYFRKPGDYLRDVLESRGMRVGDFATRCGRPQKTISEILSGVTAITPDTALQFERVLGDVPASLWINLEAAYQLARAKERERGAFKEDVTWMRCFPIKDMAEKGFVRRCADAVEQVQELLIFFGVSSASAWSAYWEDRVASARFKQATTAKQVDHYAVTAWLRRGEKEAADIECATYSEGNFRAALFDARKLTTQGWPEFRNSLVELFARSGVAIVFVPGLPKTGIRGAAYWATKDKAVIIVSDRLKSDNRFWFAVFHEAAHVLLHSKKALFLDGDPDRDGQDEEESEADDAAAEMLISSAELNQFLDNYGRRSAYPENMLRSHAKAIGISPSLFLARLQHEEIIPWGSVLQKVFEKKIEF